ncbi:DUF1043 family protein [Alteromonas stellipolaris]|uniref:ZapG family protein n=1 Tax=Alteromonas stellipolaris TaxID=233316 RepID=UPI0026E1A81F|nr:DUF1043 family protein [Alteromonas stellipolaris]MDO6537130.1 DUF1043 family protein [Alteromonas stellipolaris]MDP2595220.1 DUF1043 family protein [Alteromonas stellipolaris]
MELLVSLALLVVGLIIGFFIGRFVLTKTGGNNAAQTEQQVKEILAQQAQHHIHQTRQSLESIEGQCETLKQQIEEYEALLTQSSDDEDAKVPFYGEQATSYLRNNLKSSEKSKVNKVSDTQPKDFANSGSGLFVGGSEQSTADKS